MNYKILAIIPARGGSKGVPGKNTRMLAGKPLIAWTIEEAKKSKMLTRIIVSTDSEEIAAVAKQCGAEVPFMRPPAISGDLATDVEFLDQALEWLETNEDYAPDILLRLPPTSPLRTAQHIDEGIEKLISTPDADACRPIVETEKHPYKFWKISKEGVWLEPFLPKSFTGFDEPQNLPRQVLPKVYRHTGAMDVLWTRTLKEQGSTSGKNLTYFFMDQESSVNIDSMFDFEFAEFLMQKKLRQP